MKSTAGALLAAIGVAELHEELPNVVSERYSKPLLIDDYTKWYPQKNYICVYQLYIIDYIVKSEL